MSQKDLRDEINEEVSTILGKDFQIDVTTTTTVPHSSDGSITFPNLDTKRQGAKLIETCVLYIDIRRSTALNFSHKQQTVAKLYSAFVRAMTRCARFYKGHVRGIIGDRVMVIFDQKDCFSNAVHCAIAMNTVSQHILNKHFTRNEVECGIGIDYGTMLATKTGVRRKGVEQNNYRNLVWLGRPANVASKLTDMANKPEESFKYPIVEAGFEQRNFGILATGPDWKWREIYATDFVQQLTVEPLTHKMLHNDPTFRSMFTSERTHVRIPKTKPILMTEAVWSGYKAANPTSVVVTNKLFTEITLSVPAYRGKVLAGDPFYPDLKPE
ncbi:adenylate/guanylate cyclase domain-containing protein [Chthonobacter rhizosphaerae]|uniref:adenylate/guanylate cyclase domain-containing protein n=1 Tax=Chthonobacter rhizosphaerae TaxID=2735553 RepID=UPI0015EEEAB8|nr:adenylate/guanylate cyclase domain-containing protein [Chthonobacter rhizosphaerae]